MFFVRSEEVVGIMVFPPASFPDIPRSPPAMSDFEDDEEVDPGHFAQPQLEETLIEPDPAPAEAAAAPPPPPTTSKENNKSNYEQAIATLGLTQEQLLGLGDDGALQSLTDGIAKLAENGYLEGPGAAKDATTVSVNSKEKENDINDEEAQMWAKLKSEDFAVPARGDKGNPIAGRWARRLASDKALKEQYENTRGRAEKAAFRASWAKGAYETYMTSKTHDRTREIQTSEDGVMLSLERIVVEEGGGAGGLRAAINYAVNCIKKREAGWVRYDDMTQSVKFHYVTSRTSDRFTKTWRERQQWTGSGAAEDSTASAPKTEEANYKGGGSNAPPTSASGRQQARAVKRCANDGETPSAKKQRGGAGASSGKKVSQVKELAQVKKTRGLYLKGMAECEQMLRNIQTDEDWAWARTDAISAPLKIEQTKLLELVGKDTFAKSVINMDVMDAKKVMDAESFDKGVREFSMRLDDNIAALNKQVQMLMRQQRARMNTT